MEEYRVADADEVREFLATAFDAWDSNDPGVTHVVMPPPILAAIGSYLEGYAFADASHCERGWVPPALAAYADKYNGNNLRFSDLCMVGMLAETIATQDESPDCASPQLCVPKYLIEALFHIIMSPGFAARARKMFTVQDYT